MSYLTVWCKKTFKFTIGQIIDGISGIADFIFAPLNALVDAIINAIPIPDFPFPGLPRIDFELPSLDLPNLPALQVPPPFDKIVPLDLSKLLDGINIGNFDVDFVINVIGPAFVSTKILFFILSNQHFFNF
jgi:hypothetical protein